MQFSWFQSKYHVLRKLFAKINDVISHLFSSKLCYKFNFEVYKFKQILAVDWWFYVVDLCNGNKTVKYFYGKSVLGERVELL